MLNAEINAISIFFSLQLTESQSTIIALFYCGVKQKTQLQMNTIREACKKENIKFHKATRKDELCQLLGKSLLTSKKVEIINIEKDVTFSNSKKATA